MNPEQIIAAINHAFEIVPEPAKDSITHCSCEECMEIREDLSGKQAEDLEESLMQYHTWDMGFLTAEARHYFLPGWMRLGITKPDSAYAEAAVEILSRDDGWETANAYTADQKNSIFAFLQWIAIKTKSCPSEKIEHALERWRPPTDRHLDSQ